MTAQEKNQLSNFVFDDKLTDVEVLEQWNEMKGKKQIVQAYGDKIKYRKDDNRYYIYIERKQYSCVSYDDLITLLYQKFGSNKNATLKQLYEEWLTWKKDYTSVTPKTMKEYVSLWKNKLEGEAITQMQVRKIKSIDFTNLFRKLTKNRALTKKAFNNIKSLLNGVMQYALEQEIILINPLDAVNCKLLPFKPVNNSNEVFSIEDRKSLLNHLENKTDMYALAIQLDFHVVMRIGELLALRWSDIEDNCIHIQGQRVRNYDIKPDGTFSSQHFENVNHVKGYADAGFRYMPITKECSRVLEQIRQLNPDGEFILMQNGKQLLADTFNEHLKNYCRECNIKPHSSHKIRFTVASILYSRGVPLQALQKLLGHTTPAMTLHYLRMVTPMAETIDIMNRALG